MEGIKPAYEQSCSALWNLAMSPISDLTISAVYGPTPGMVQSSDRRPSPRRSKGVLRTFFSGLEQKVAPYFFQSLHSLQKICHAFCARTFDFFFSLRGYGQTHFKKSACTHFTRPYTLRGAKVPRSFLSFIRAFVPLGSPRNPARPAGRVRMH